MGGNEEQPWQENAQNITTLSTLIGMRWRSNWTRCPHCGKLCKPSRFKAATVLVPIELVIFVVCIFFRNSMNDAIGWFAAWLLFVLLFLPQYIYVRFFMPYETLSEDETRKFRDLQEH